MSETRERRCAICKGPAQVHVFDRRFDGELHPWTSCLEHMDQSHSSDAYFKVSFIAYDTLDTNEAIRLAWGGATEKRIDPKQPLKMFGPTAELARVRAALGLDVDAPLEQEAALIRKERDDLRSQVAEMSKELERLRIKSDDFASPEAAQDFFAGSFGY